MLRIKSSSLTYESQKYFYRKQPFTGIGFDLLANGNCQAFEYFRGIRLENYTSEYLSANKYANSIYSFEFIDADTFFIFQSKRFSGIVYFFDEKYCWRESLYEDGKLCEEISWFPSGELENIFINRDIYQEITWFENGKLEEYELITSNHINEYIQFLVKFTATAELECLRIDAEYFNCLPNIKDQISFKDKVDFSLFSKQDLVKECTAGSFIFICGLDIDDEVFDSLRAFDGLKQVTKMFLSKSSLSAESIKKLSKDSNLKELDVDDEREFMPQALKQFKQAQPDCSVLLNDKIIRA